ncbi:MAG: SAM hydrolase/SAM-dependent halogenase family protein [bacterium]
MPSAVSVVTLLTDFGDRDYFVASMKGVILNINPQARIVDLSHQIAPQQVGDAAYLLGACYRYFPEGTVHVAVVDPGVGSARRPLLVTTSRYFFLAPDNGLLTPIFDEELNVEARKIDNRQYRLDSEGATFDGRDLFAPAAAWLTRGQQPGSFGPLIQDAVRLPGNEPTRDGPVLVGQVVYIDRFGNLITNITAAHVQDMQRSRKQGGVTFRLKGVHIEGLASHYAAGSDTKPAGVINSNGQVEFFVKDGNCAELLKCRQGERVEVV